MSLTRIVLHGTVLVMLTGCTATKLHMISMKNDGSIIQDHTMYRASVGQKVDCDVKTPEGWIVTYRNDGGSQMTAAAIEGFFKALIQSREAVK